jgi:hypothetical protein
MASRLGTMLAFPGKKAFELEASEKTVVVASVATPSVAEALLTRVEPPTAKGAVVVAMAGLANEGEFQSTSPKMLTRLGVCTSGDTVLVAAPPSPGRGDLGVAERPSLAKAVAGRLEAGEDEPGASELARFFALSSRWPRARGPEDIMAPLRAPAGCVTVVGTVGTLDEGEMMCERKGGSKGELARGRLAATTPTVYGS